MVREYVSILDLMDCRVKTIIMTVSLLFFLVSILDLMDCRVKTVTIHDAIADGFPGFNP